MMNIQCKDCGLLRAYPEKGIEYCYNYGNVVSDKTENIDCPAFTKPGDCALCDTIVRSRVTHVEDPSSFLVLTTCAAGNPKNREKGPCPHFYRNPDRPHCYEEVKE